MTGIRCGGFATAGATGREELGNAQIALRGGREQVVLCVIVRVKIRVEDICRLSVRSYNQGW